MRREVEVLRLVKVNQGYIKKIEKYIREKYDIDLNATKDFDDEAFREKVICQIFKKNLGSLKMSDKYPIKKIADMDELEKNMLNKYGCLSKELQGRMNATDEDLIKWTCTRLKEHIYIVLLSAPYMSDEFLKRIFILSGYNMSEWGKYECDKLRRTPSLVDVEYLPWAFDDGFCMCTYIKKIEDVIFQKSYITMFDCFRSMMAEDKGEEKRDDITRYGYEIVVDVLKEVEEENEQHSLKNLLILDDLLGITLTNVIFTYTTDCSATILKKVYDLAMCLGKIKYVSARNWLADIVFGYLSLVEFEEKVMDYIGGWLNGKVRKINMFLRDLERVLLWDYCQGNISTNWWNENFQSISNDCGMEWKEEIAGKTIKLADAYHLYSDKKRQRIMVSRQKASLQERYAGIHCHVMQGIWSKE